MGKTITLTVKYQDKLGADESVVSGPTAQVLASFSQSTSADEIFQGMVGKDSFQFVKQLGNQHGTDVIRGFLKNEDQLWIVGYDKSKITQKLDASGYDKFIFTEDSGTSALTIETPRLLRPLKLQT